MMDNLNHQRAFTDGERVRGGGGNSCNTTNNNFEQSLHHPYSQSRWHFGDVQRHRGTFQDLLPEPWDIKNQNKTTPLYNHAPLPSATVALATAQPLLLLSLLSSSFYDRE
ncbi:unnamed protein product [Gadus morhua 'NCC']